MKEADAGCKGPSVMRIRRLARAVSETFGRRIKGTLARSISDIEALRDWQCSDRISSLYRLEQVRKRLQSVPHAGTGLRECLMREEGCREFLTLEMGCR
jgi:hypothetical protein